MSFEAVKAGRDSKAGLIGQRAKQRQSNLKKQREQEAKRSPVPFLNPRV